MHHPLLWQSPSLKTLPAFPCSTIHSRILSFTCHQTTHDPNWSLLQRGCLVSKAEVFKFCLWNLSLPPGSSLLGWGNQKLTNTNNKSSSFGWSLQASFPDGGHIKQDILSALHQLDRTPFLTGHGRSLLHSIKHTPVQLVNKLSDWGPVYVPT